MPELPGLGPTAFTIFSYVVCVKLAARLYRRTQLGWTHACVFAVVLFIVLFAVGAAVRSLGDNSDPINQSLADIASGLVAQLGLGAWLLGSRARTTAGAPLELKGGALLALMTYGLVFSLSFAAAIALPLFARLAGNHT
ncbi:MAG: hypothetical protein ABI893_01330 [Polaromonas sp.]|uniref:hypothetical protein n=1 Tax=Polaromonas sp. TaxID=1869339 RepID=UPI00326711CF